jgi:hypothetical protein
MRLPLCLQYDPLHTAKIQITSCCVKAGDTTFEGWNILFQLVFLTLGVDCPPSLVDPPDYMPASKCVPCDLVWPPAASRQTRISVEQPNKWTSFSSFKGTLARDFQLQVFFPFIIDLIWTPDLFPIFFSNLVKTSRRYGFMKMNQRRWYNISGVSHTAGAVSALLETKPERPKYEGISGVWDSADASSMVSQSVFIQIRQRWF